MAGAAMARSRPAARGSHSYWRRDRFVEIQSTAEGNPFTLERFNRLLEVAKNGCQKIFEVQSSIIDELMRA